MRWIKFIYEQYRKDLEQGENMNVLPERVEKAIEPRIGEIYLFNTIYFVISDIEYYPYEVFIVSPYWELASNEDLIVDGKEQRWVIESIVRYVGDEILAASLKVDEISEKDVNTMKAYIDEGKPLPENQTGLSYIEGKGFYQELFKESERKRSLFLMPDLGYEQDIEDEIVIDLSQYVKDLENTLNQRLAAASFDGVVVAEYGDITEENRNLVVYFNEKYAGALAKVYAGIKLLYEGFLPKKLILKSTLKHPQNLLEILKIEPL